MDSESDNLHHQEQKVEDTEQPTGTTTNAAESLHGVSSEAC